MPQAPIYAADLNISRRYHARREGGAGYHARKNSGKNNSGARFNGNVNKG
jgi:hypothetical protein